MRHSDRGRALPPQQEPGPGNGPAAPGGAPSSRVWLGARCFLVDAQALPNGTNLRPGLTLLLSPAGPMHLNVDGIGDIAVASLLVPPQRARRFVHVQPHLSLTIEPGHRLYAAYLQWARSAALPQVVTPAVAAPDVHALAQVRNRGELDDWLASLLAAHGHGGPPAPAGERLAALFEWLDPPGPDEPPPSAEQVWQRFSLRFGGTPSQRSRWLAAEIGLSLRELLLWRKLRRALELLATQNQATDIAHGSGFADSSHLWRVCTRAFGLRPADAIDRKIIQVSWLPDP